MDFTLPTVSLSITNWNGKPLEKIQTHPLPTWLPSPPPVWCFRPSPSRHLWYPATVKVLNTIITTSLQTYLKVYLRLLTLFTLTSSNPLGYWTWIFNLSILFHHKHHSPHYWVKSPQGLHCFPTSCHWNTSSDGISNQLLPVLFTHVRLPSAIDHDHGKDQVIVFLHAL